MRQVQPIPVVVVEEHHEAFYAWCYALKKRWIDLSSNTLLHVDTHADMLLPRLRRSLNSIADLEEVACFTYRELDISSFIWPAAYFGLFNRVLWLKDQQRLSSGGWQNICIYSKNSEHTEFALATSAQHSFPPNVEGVTRRVQYCPVTTKEKLNNDQPFLLDIDLDYFCCNQYPQIPLGNLEVTRGTFEEFKLNPYHFLRTRPAEKISAVQLGKRYFLVYNDYCPQLPPSESRMQEGKRRLADLTAYLHCHTVVPKMVVLCRSFYSGYTPGEFVEDLQEAVIDALGQLFPVTAISLRDILPPNRLLADRNDPGRDLAGKDGESGPPHSEEEQIPWNGTCTRLDTVGGAE